MAKYSDEELSRIREILNPLNENPIVTESLNPMGKVLRKIKGEPEPEEAPPIEEGDGGINFEDSPPAGDEPPEFKNFDEDDDSIDDLLDVDIDSLGKEKEPEEESLDLGEDEPPVVEEDIPSFDEEPVSEEIETPNFDEEDIPSFDEEPVSEEIETPNFDEEDIPSFDEEPVAEEDPFANVTPDLGTEPEEEEDPFADLGAPKSGATDFGGEDPFAEAPPIQPDFGEEELAPESGEE
ncbi:MAG: hypothetical protein EBS19_11185, partial [Spirochaetia bacterium]|nr:hypothetical protein [Spirochaetia bacterium]